MTQQAVATTERKSLAKEFANKYNMEVPAMMSTLKDTVFRQKNGQVTDSQMAMLMLVANEYNLNPFTKEIYAYPDKGGIVPVVGVDGWSRIINENSQFNGLEFNQSDTLVTPDGGKPCPEWMEVVIYRKDRDHPVKVREYIDEVYKKSNYTSPWQTHTKRFFRHKTLIQGARIAFGFTGIYDQDEADNIIQGQVVEINTATAEKVDSIIEVVAEEVIETETVETTEQVQTESNNTH